MDILSVTDKIRTDDSIINYEFHNHTPFGSTTFDNNDEIRITIPEIDNYTLPCESYLYVEGRLRTAADDNVVSKTAILVNNPVAFMLNEIRYLLNGVQVDSVRNVGVTSCMKGYFSFTKNEIDKLENAGWNVEKHVLNTLDEKGNFSMSVPLKTLLGFAEDFKKIVMNVRQELILVRANDDTDVIVQSNPEEKVKLTIERIVWRMPHVTVGLRQQLYLTKLAEKNVQVQVPFRSWEIHEYPSLPQTKTHSWSVKTAPQLETPRFIIIGFQKNKKGVLSENMSTFDNVKLTTLSVFLNGERYPYENINIDFDNNHFAVLYDMYARFQQAYYHYSDSEPLYSPTMFKTHIPLVGIDCMYQKDVLHKSGVEIRIEFSTKENIPANTTAYCLILHDKAFQYSPLNKIVQQLM